MFRVMVSNEWQGVLFSALDTVGYEMQPKINYNRAGGGGAFIFFFIFSLLGQAIGALYIGIFYYHYVVACALSGRKALIGTRDAMWAMYEEKLILCKPGITITYTPSPTHPNPNPLTITFSQKL